VEPYPIREFKEAAARAAAEAGLDLETARAAVVVPRERARADLSLPCFPFAKAARKAPAAVAQEVARAFRPGPLLVAAEAAGPFVNFRAERTAWAAKTLDRIARDGEAYGSSMEGAGIRIVIEYSAPNIAKPLLFHHIRSAVIGQALVRLYRFTGHDVVALNYLGDVGTGFGKLLYGVRAFGEAHDAESLFETYVRASKACESDPAAMEEARAWTKRLEDRDPEAIAIWERARAISLEGFERVYRMLGVAFDRVDGESMYVERGNALVDELLAQGKARISDGAVVVDAPDPSLPPVLLRKSDGATLYHTRDFAAAIDRFERYRFDRMLYVVDVAQELHFRQLFGGLKAIGHAWADRCAHVAFGQVLFGGTRAKSREGTSVKLDEVLAEAQRRAAAIIAEKNPSLPNREEVARAVGIGAVIFSDLGNQIRRDVDFEWDKILSFDGRTGPYLQYAHASACSILRKANDRGGGGDPSRLAHDLEWDLLRRLAEFPEEVRRACAEHEPSVVAGCLYELAREFRAYHAAGGKEASLRVLSDDPALRAARLRLVDAVRRTLANGLRLLGIEPVEEM
jgi:arginyl-tRNA synthetase